MVNEARLIEEIKEILADVEPDAARRVIDYLATTYRAELADQENGPPRASELTGQTDKRPSFLQTEARIEAGEVLLELERRAGSKGKR